MKCKTVNEAIIKVLQKEAMPLSSRDIYDKIVYAGLYTFRSATPHHIVFTQLRRHCEGVEFKTANKEKYYRVDSQKRYSLK